MDLRYRKSFKKQYIKLQLKDKGKVDKALEMFEENPHDPILRNHPLSGDLEGRRSISASFNIRIIFHVEGEYITVTMLNVGTHNQVY